MIDENELRRLLAQGYTPEELGVGQNALAEMMQMPEPRYDIAPMQQNTMRFESGPDQGRVVSMDFAQAQPQSQEKLGAAVELPGGQRGRYSMDGRSVVLPDGLRVSLFPGADAAKAKADFEARKNLSALAYQDAQTRKLEGDIAAEQGKRDEALRERQMMGSAPQALLEKKYGKAPEGARWRLDGTLEAIQMPDGVTGKLNESQAKAAGMGSRALAAHNLLTELEDKGVTTPSIIKMGAESVPLIGGALGMAANAMVASPDQRKVDQLQRDFINAVLRPESGASISASEFDNARKQYFPQPNDDAEAIRLKQEARERELNALSIMAGPGASQMRKTTVSGAERARAIFEAKQAIAKGANPVAVRQRLQSLGINDGL